MTDIRRLYGETRALIQQQAPSQELFFEICEVVAKAWEYDDAQTMAEFFPFVNESLRNWPDHLRTCPPFWEDHFRTKPHYEAYEPLQLIRRIVFSKAWKTTRIRGFGKSMLAASIRHITLPHYQGGNATRLRELCHGTTFGFVRELHIEERPARTTRHEWLPGLLDWPASRGTTMLKIHRYSGGQEEPGAMLDFGDSFPDLEEFWLMHATLSGETLSEMLSSTALTKLTEIDLGY